MTDSLELAQQVAAAQRGEPGAARAVFDHLHREVVAFCSLAASGDRELALGLAGEIFAEAFRRLGGLSDPEGFQPLLWAIAARQVRSRQPDLERRAVLEAFTLSRPGGVAALDETDEERAERLALIKRVVERVEDERARAVARARLLEGREPAEIARAMGLPPGTVTLKLARFHDQVKRELCKWAVAPAPGGGAP